MKWIVALLALGGCAAPGAPESSVTAYAPAFCADGRFRRDVATGAPLYVAAPGSCPGRAPRFHDDGTVARDGETGRPLHEVVAPTGEVVRVLLLPSR